MLDADFFLEHSSWFRKVAVTCIYATISSEKKEERPAADMNYRQRATNG